MSNNIIKIGIPSKGRLRSGVLKIFKKKKLKILSERGERDLFGFIKRKKNIVINYLHAREIIERLADGSLDIGFSGYDLLKRLETNSDIDPTIVEIDKKKYSKMINGNQKKEIAGRSIEEILLRFDTKIKDPRRTKKGSNVVKILKEYLKIECPINQASKKLNLFFKKNKINLRVQDDYFPITKNKINKLNVRFNSSFGRHLEYYTGLVFKIDIKSKSEKLNIRGGRYDSLIKDLGFKKNIPAVGAAINLEKI